MGKGMLTAITGCMFSGKTTELLRLLKRFIIARHIVQLFKPDIDRRYGEKNKVVSHDQAFLEAIEIPIDNPHKILEYIQEDTTMIGIDEIQFFDSKIVEVVDTILSRNIDVIIAGLKQDSKGELFGSMDKFLVKANIITNLTAVCVDCGEDATMTQWKLNKSLKKDQIAVGGTEDYDAVCHRHHVPA